MSPNFNLPIGLADFRRGRMSLVNWVRTIAVLLLLAALLFSVSELFDTWDNTPQTGNDVEYNSVLVILCVGAAIACVRALWLTLLALGRRLRSELIASVFSPDQFTPTAEFAAPLRNTSLRI